MEKNMNLLKIIALVVVVMATNMGVADAKCNENCRRETSYPCGGTWNEPIRTCTAAWDDPACSARNLACKGELAACLTGAWGTYVGGGVCIAAIVADAAAGGSITPATVVVCGVSAEILQETIKRCD